MDVRAHLTIKGRVQGVWFRANTKEQAGAHGVKGWVKNLPDGCVEAVFEGNKKKVEELVQWCHKGPELSHVESVEVRWETPVGLTGSFTIHY